MPRFDGRRDVVVDLSGGEEAIFSRMKPRGRRDVRKALRECPASMADETDLAAASFGEYHKIMCDTAARDGFVPAPCSYYANMMRVLGPDHCRVYAARIDGELVGWSLVTISGSVATRYYAATVSGAGRLHVADATATSPSRAGSTQRCRASRSCAPMQRP